ncbi:MAG: hypothetical protein H0V42_00610 [Nocardioidaceae bacterium]|nr:hypothetical protein [Nocardioidaceae bacterium]
MSLTSLTTTIAPGLSEGAANEPAVSPYLVGVLTFVILMALLAVLTMFGAGRDHS